MLAIGLVLVACAGFATASRWLPASAPPEQSAAAPAANPHSALLNGAHSLGHAPTGFGQSGPLAAWRPLAPPPAAKSPAAREPERPDDGAILPLPPLPAAPLAVAPQPALPASPQTAAAPLPVPRPPSLRPPETAEPPRLAAKTPMRRAKTAAAAVQPEDNRNFFQKLFGVPQQPATALAYAAPQDDVVDRGRATRLSPLVTPPPVTAAATAVYDISARTLYLPNGERLEAHSGLGDKMDDPRYVHVRMHGATPPHVYNLTERESLFHGHRAVRLHPVGGSGAIYGRAGLLLHPYLLGPGGDSNGCVSVRDYQRFLQAFLRGEVKRLVVVAGNGAPPPAIALNAARD
ncbi:MAG: tlde1 domain-containing protein [Bosea sp. (in: a-proteobacteria)]